MAHLPMHPHLHQKKDYTWRCSGRELDCLSRHAARYSAVYDEFDPGYVFGLVGCKEQGSKGNIPGVTKALHGNDLLALIDHLLSITSIFRPHVVFDQWGVHQTGQYGVCSDAFVSVFNGNVYASPKLEAF